MVFHIIMMTSSRLETLQSITLLENSHKTTKTSASRYEAITMHDLETIAYTSDIIYQLFTSLLPISPGMYKTNKTPQKKREGATSRRQREQGSRGEESARERKEFMNILSRKLLSTPSLLFLQPPNQTHWVDPPLPLFSPLSTPRTRSGPSAGPPPCQAP